jgi:large subunit ribosomal protein L33
MTSGDPGRGPGTDARSGPTGLTHPTLPHEGPRKSTQSRFAMAKATTIKVKLVSSADTGFYYVTRKNSRTMTDKLVKKKYDPVAKKHVEFREAKIK